jgi:hypothetical protein
MCPALESITPALVLEATHSVARANLPAQAAAEQPAVEVAPTPS